jgi:hypothetical protein
LKRVVQERRREDSERQPDSDELALVESAEGESVDVEAELAQLQTTRMFCNVCGAFRAARVCHKCGMDLLTGELGALPAEPGPDEGEVERRRPERPELVAPPELNLPRFLLRVGREALRGLPATLMILLMVFGALSYQLLPFVGKIPWPGQIMASFVLTYCLIERTRTSRSEADEAFEIVETGATLFRAFMAFPIVAGLASGHWAALPVGLILAPIAPLVVGAYSNPDLRELHPRALLDAFWATPHYTRAVLFTALFLGAAVTAVYYSEGNLAWRAPLAVFGTTLAGCTIGLSRRDAENTPEDWW